MKHVVLGRLIVPLIMMLFAAYYFREAINLPRPEINAMLIRPVFYILTALVVAIVIQEFLRVTDDSKRKLSKTYWKKFIPFLIVTIGLTQGMPYLGLAITAVIYMGLAMFILGERNIKILLVWSIGISAITVLIFDVWLGLPIPKGPFGF